MTIVSLDRFCQLRLGGLSSTVAKELAPHSAHVMVGEYLKAWRRLAAGQQEISDRLHELIAGQPADSEHRRPLILLRRSLYQSDHRAAAQVFDGLSPMLRRTVDSSLEHYLDDLAICQVIEAEAQTWQPEWMSIQRAQLGAQSSNSTMELGIGVASTVLAPYLERYRRHLTENRIDKRDRRVERSLISYILRASTKTTPFSTLGPVAVVTTDATSSEQIATAGARASRWSIYPVARVLNAVAGQEQLLSSLPARLSPDIHGDDKLLVDRTIWTFRDLDSRDDYAACVESTTTIAAYSVVEALQSLLTDQELTFGELEIALATKYEIGSARAHRIALDALRLGLVILPTLTVHPHDSADDVLARFPAAVQGQAGQLRTQLLKYRHQAQEFANSTGATARAHAITQLREVVRDLYEKVDIEASEPRSVVYEDQVLPSNELTRSAAPITPSSAEQVLRFVELLDAAQPKRALLNGYAAHVRDGKIDKDVGSFLRRFRAELLDSYEAYDTDAVSDDDLADNPWLRWGDAWRWEHSRRAISAIFTTQSRVTPLAGADLSLGCTTIDLLIIAAATLAEAPQFQDAFRHAHLIIQSGDHRQQTVLNDAFGGTGFVVSRFSHLLSQPTTDYVRDVADRAEQVGVVLTEITGGAVFTNLNLHSPVLAHRLIMPGDPPIADTFGIGLRDLRLGHDERSGQAILLDPDSRVVHPTYPGYLIPAATPRSHQALTLFTPSATLSRNPVTLVDRNPKPGEAVLIPRMTVGGVVFVRAAARLCATDLPDADPCSAVGYTSWLRFWARTGLPTRIFVRIRPPDAARRSKPFFVDPAVILSLSQLHHQLRTCTPDTVVELTEVLPNPQDANVQWNGTPHVAESMVGVSITKEIR